MLQSAGFDRLFGEGGQEAEVAAMLAQSADRFLGTLIDEVPDTVLGQVADCGWIGLRVPEALGGSGLSASMLALLMRHVGPSHLDLPLGELAAAAVHLIAASPNRALRDPLLRALLAGDCRMAVAVFADSDGIPILDDSGADRVVNGTQQVDLPSTEIDGFLVRVRTAGGDPAVLWLPADRGGVSFAGKARADGSPCADVALVDVRVDEADVLLEGADAERRLGSMISETTLMTAAELSGLADRALSITLDHLRTREQFGRPIGSFQALQHRAVDMFVHKRLADAALAESVVEHEAASGGEAGAVAAGRAKARCSQAAMLITHEAVQMHGAIGYTQESEVARLLCRCIVRSGRHGTASWHRERLRQRFDAAAGPESRTSCVAPLPFEPTDWDAVDDDRFRATVRAYFETRYPARLRNPPRRMHWHEMKDWYRQMSAIGWVAPAWPKQHGGAGLSAGKQLILLEEQERWGVARAPDMGVTIVGPTLIRYGTEEQRARYLPPILAGEHVWCQGYSEPNAGSDLSSLTTSAEDDGDAFLVTGQKIWTTLAQDATHMFAIVRTDRGTERKQDGLSFLLVDLATPGLTIRPIPVLGGHHEFCEVFFDAVRVPKSDLVGERGKGWTIAKALLEYERIYLGSPRQSRHALGQLRRFARETGLLGNASFRDRYTRLELDVLDLAACYREFADRLRRGEQLGPDVSILKIWATQTYQRIAEELLESAGEVVRIPDEAGWDAQVDPLAIFFNSRPATIYGGSNEVQKNVVAKRVLGLPV